MSDYSMADIAGLLGATNTNPVKNSTSRANNTDLTMQDFLQLMVVQLQNQTMDDTMDTSEMMNQMVQMQMVTAITNMTEASMMSYASSLVGKIVTIGITDGNTVEEREIEVTGTGVLNGQQVIFGSDGETYALNQIMAVGKLPPLEDVEDPEKPGDSTDIPVEGPDQPGEGGETSGENTTTPPVEGSGETGGAGSDPTYNGEQGAPTEGVG